MARKKKSSVSQEAINQLLPQVDTLQEQYLEKLDTDVQYSLKVDPENKYNMPELQKTFISHYVEYKSIAMAAQLTGIDADTATQYFVAYSSQQEIRRINKALYQRQFANKLLSLDEISGYLTSLLTGENVPIADQPHKVSEKLEIIRMLIELNRMKAEGMINPQILMSNNIEVQIKQLSLSTIKHLLAEDTSRSTLEISDQRSHMSTQNPNLTPEETAYLSTLPTEELLKLIDESNGGNKK